MHEGASPAPSFVGSKLVRYTIYQAPGELFERFDQALLPLAGPAPTDTDNIIGKKARSYSGTCLPYAHGQHP